MPTGYTADLESRKYNIASWLKEGVIRAMGVCVKLRDSAKMTAKEISTALKNEADDSYHAKKLKESQEALLEFKSTNLEKLKLRYEAELSIAKEDFTKREEEFNKKKRLHHEAILKTQELYQAAVDEKQGELTINTLKFALDQLNQAFGFDYDGGPYQQEILKQDFETWNLESRKRILRDITYHGKELEKESNRNVDRLKEYEKFVAWVDSKTGQPDEETHE